MQDVRGTVNSKMLEVQLIVRLERCRGTVNIKDLIGTVNSKDLVQQGFGAAQI